MQHALPMRIPIENFIVTYDPNQPNRCRLIYFDPRGQRHEVWVRKSAMDSAIQKLDGKPKAIARSSGGVASAQPYQLVLHHPMGDNTGLPPELRIKVRFKEFAKNEAGHITTGGTISVTKNVLPEEVLDQIHYDVSHSRKFLVDFGSGVVPVTVFGFITEKSGETFALLVESDLIEKLIKEKPGTRIAVPRFKVPKDMVRVVRDTVNGAEIFEKAAKNAEVLRGLNQELIPEALMIGQPIELSTGSDFNAIFELLRKSVHRWNSIEEDVTLNEIHVEDQGCVTSDFVMYLEPA